MQKHIRRKQEAHRKARAICEDIRGTIEATDGGKKWLAKFNASVDDVEELFTDQQQARNKQRLAKADVDGARTAPPAIIKGGVGRRAVVRLDEGAAKGRVGPADGTAALLIPE